MPTDSDLGNLSTLYVDFQQWMWVEQNLKPRLHGDSDPDPDPDWSC